MQDITWADFEGSANYVKIKVGKAKTLTLSAVRQELAEIQDKDSGEVKKVPSLIFSVTHEDGQPAVKEFSVTSKQLVKKLRPFVENGFPFAVTIHSSGERFEREYEVVAVQ